MSKQVRRIAMPSWIDPSLAFLALQKEFPHIAWLDSGVNATSGFSYIAGTKQSAHLFSSENHAQVYPWLTDELEAFREIETDHLNNDGFSLGWIGWLGYELGAEHCNVPVSQSEYPIAAFMFATWALEFNHSSGKLSLLSLGSEQDAHQNKEALLQILHDTSEDLGDFGHPTEVHWRHSPEDYKNLVQKCLDSISAGDAYQLCLTNTVEIKGVFNPVAVYEELRKANPSHHGGFLRLGEYSLLSSSPEIFLRVTKNGRISTKPIKGTRPRGDNQQKDLALATELVLSEKERAENLMIVDLMRNDVGKVSQLGSVQVESLLQVESYQSVHQLVSTVTAQLEAGRSPIDVISSCFPAGSMTGAPKISAMKILNELEQGPRGIYSGAFGYIGLDGAIDLAMVIRSIVISAEKASIGTGGGITSGSVPQAELEETFIKVAPLLKALGAF